MNSSSDNNGDSELKKRVSDKLEKMSLSIMDVSNHLYDGSKNDELLSKFFVEAYYNSIEARLYNALTTIYTILDNVLVESTRARISLEKNVKLWDKSHLRYPIKFEADGDTWSL